MSSQRHHGADSTISGLPLPEGVLEHLIATSNQRQLARVASVCREWRDAVVMSRMSLSVNLKSDAGATSLCTWLQHYACQLQQIEIAHVGTYGRSCHPSNRLKLFQVLHAACGSAAAGAAPDTRLKDHSSSSSSSDSKADDHAALISTDSVAATNISTQEAGEGAAEDAAAAVQPQEGRAATPQQQQSNHHQQQQQSIPQRPKTLQLTHLGANMRLAPADCAAIASLPAINLTSLQLLGSRTRRLAIDGVRSLLQLHQLSSLTVSKFGIGDDATVLLAQGLTGLRVLCLSGNNIGALGAGAIGKHLTQLQHLDLSVNRIQDAGLTALCSLHSLQTLNLTSNIRLNPTTLQNLHTLSTLSSLQLGSNSICNQGLAAVAAALPQLAALDLSGNKIHKADALTAFVGLSSLCLSRNPLQLGCAKVIGGLTGLQELVLFDAVAAKSVVHLSGLAGSLTSLTVGVDPSLNPEDTPNLPLAKTRTCNMLFGPLADAQKLRVLSIPCCGLEDAGAKVLGRFGRCLTALNLSYNCLHTEGLKFLKDLPELRRLELRMMRPELPDDVAHVITTHCNKVTLLDLAYNDLSSEGVRQLGCGALSNLQHLNLRNNVQVEKPAIVAAAKGLTALTYLNLLELSDVYSRVIRGVASHADVWAAFPNLQELVVGSYEVMGPFRDARVVFSQSAQH